MSGNMMCEVLVTLWNWTSLTNTLMNCTSSKRDSLSTQNSVSVLACYCGFVCVCECLCVCVCVCECGGEMGIDSCRVRTYGVRAYGNTAGAVQKYMLENLFRSTVCLYV